MEGGKTSKEAAVPPRRVAAYPDVAQDRQKAKGGGWMQEYYQSRIPEAWHLVRRQSIKEKKQGLTANSPG